MSKRATRQPQALMSCGRPLTFLVTGPRSRRPRRRYPLPLPSAALPHQRMLLRALPLLGPSPRFLARLRFLGGTAHRRDKRPPAPPAPPPTVFSAWAASHGRGRSCTSSRARYSSHCATITRSVQRSHRARSWNRGVIQPHACLRKRIDGSIGQRCSYQRDNGSNPTAAPPCAANRSGSGGRSRSRAFHQEDTQVAGSVRPFVQAVPPPQPHFPPAGIFHLPLLVRWARGIRLHEGEPGPVLRGRAPPRIRAGRPIQDPVAAQPHHYQTRQVADPTQMECIGARVEYGPAGGARRCCPGQSRRSGPLGSGGAIAAPGGRTPGGRPQGGIETGPAVAKDRDEGQLDEGAQPGTEEQGVERLAGRLAGAGDDLIIERLSKRHQVATLESGEQC
jgi:hypothetical protein